MSPVKRQEEKSTRQEGEISQAGASPMFSADLSQKDSIYVLLMHSRPYSNT